MLTHSVVLVGVTLLAASVAAASPLDTIVFGDVSSEQSHQLSTDRGAIITGGLGQTARQLLPLDPPSDYGGKVSFTVKVDPERPNYFTIKLWGEDRGNERGRLLLFCESKQVGWRHIGEVDCLDILTDEPRFPGRFTYVTTILPKAMTRGRDSVNVEVRSLGRIWGYGNTWEQFQKKLEQPSRGIYRAYTHVEPFFAAPSDETQGSAMIDAPRRQSPGPEVLDQIKKRVNDQVNALLASEKPISQMQMQLLAKAYDVSWTHAHQNPRAIEQIVKCLDALFAGYRKDPKLAHEEQSTWNPDWFGLGVCGQVIALRREQLSPCFDELIDDGKGGRITRRAAFTEMLVECRDWHRMNRRLYTNQTMLNDLNGIYHANRGIAVLNPDKALPEQEARRYLYESVGIEPWRNSDPGGKRWDVADNYVQLTAKGLTKELGYVGTYGEVIDLVCDIYDATRPAPGESGDEKIKQQLIKIAKARAAFRYPSIDADCNRIMRIEQVIGWRDGRHPGEMAYGQRPTRDGSALQAAAATLDPFLVGYAQQAIDDNQFFTTELHAMGDGAQPLRTTIGRLETVDQYDLITKQTSSPHRLPMTPGQPDFVFSDEEDGVVAIKNGDEILYASLYWRARFAVNSLARVHFITPTIERDATVWEDAQLAEDSGQTYTRDGRTIEQQTTRHEHAKPADLKQALEGEVLPIAKVPGGIPFKPGQESVYAGKASFYTLRYGDYLIGMNCTKDRSFSLKVEPPSRGARELVSGADVREATIEVRPMSTSVVWYGTKR